MNIYYLKSLKLVVICIPRKYKLVYYLQKYCFISDKVWYGSYFIFLRIARKNTMVERYFYNFTKLFLKDINKTIIYCNSNNRVTACSYCKLLMSGRVIGTDRGSFCFLRVLVSQNDCLIKVMLSVFRVHELVILHYHIRTRTISLGLCYKIQKFWWCFYYLI